jgi:hypothetical protein
MPPAYSRELRSDAPSSGQIIVQPPPIFKSLRLSRSALVAEHFDRLDTRTVKPRARCLFLARTDQSQHLASVPLLTDDSQIGANLQVCADEENRADFDQRG